MRRQVAQWVLGLGCLVATQPLLAQDETDRGLQRRIEIVREALEAGLELNAADGQFGVNRGQVQARYLRHQGVLFEIRSPLVSARNRLFLSGLAASLQSIQYPANPFATIGRASAEAASTTLAFAAPDADSRPPSPSLLERLTDIDLTASISATLRQARLTLRTLRDATRLDPARDAELESRLTGLQDSLAGQQAALVATRDRVRLQMSSGVGNNPSAVDPAAVTALEQQILALQQQAQALADELHQLNAEAQSAHAAQWRAQVGSLEDRLYALLCEHGSGLQTLPDPGYINVILVDMGGDGTVGVPRDRIHVLANTDLLRCANGQLTAEGLRAVANVYDD